MYHPMNLYRDTTHSSLGEGDKNFVVPFCCGISWFPDCMASSGRWVALHPRLFFSALPFPTKMWVEVATSSVKLLSFLHSAVTLNMNLQTAVCQPYGIQDSE